MSLSNLNPHIRYANTFYATMNRRERSQCYDCRLFLILEGNGSVYIEGERHEYTPGTAIYCPPGTRYIYDYSRKVRQLNFNFDLVSDYAGLKKSLGTPSEAEFDAKKMPQYPIPKEFRRPIVIQMPRLSEPLQSCIDEFLTRPLHYRERCSAVLKSCLLELLRAKDAEPEAIIIREITDYVHKHFSDPGLTNERIAEAFHYHPYYISQLMKKNTGSTLHQYLLHYRIRIAKNKLISTDADISTICWQCGFNSPAHFTKIFKEQTDMTPKQYRKAHIDLAF